MSSKNNERLILRYNIDKHYIQNNKIKIFGKNLLKTTKITVKYYAKDNHIN